MSNQLVDHSHPEYQYLDLMKDIMDHGVWKESHSTGVKLKECFWPHVPIRSVERFSASHDQKSI